MRLPPGGAGCFPQTKRLLQRCNRPPVRAWSTLTCRAIQTEVMTGTHVMVANETAEQQLARAKGYPYPRPNTSFLFIAGDVFVFDNTEWRGLDNLHNIVGRCGTPAASFAASRGVDLAALSRPQLFQPVLAIGSNAGPEQLRRKYPLEQFPDCIIPVVQVELEGFDVVYTPYIASYGSCTATLEPSPGTTVSIFVTYLTEPLMRRMHATEGGYNLCRLTGLQLRVAPLQAASAAAATTAAATATATAQLGAPSPGARQRTMEQAAEAGAAGGAVAAAAAATTPVAVTTPPIPADRAAFGGCGNGGFGGDGDDNGVRTGAGSEPVGAGSGGSSRWCGEVLEAVYQYNHKLGCLELPVEGPLGVAATPVAIAEIPARGRVFPAACQVQVLEAIRRGAEAAPGAQQQRKAGSIDQWGPLAPVRRTGVFAEQPDSGGFLRAGAAAGASGGAGGDVGEPSVLDEWILANVRHRGVRTALCGRLALHARPFVCSQAEVLEAL